MRDLLVAMIAFPVLALFWVAVQHITRHYSLRHPEFGVHREEGSGCSGNCRCTATRKCKDVSTPAGR